MTVSVTGDGMCFCCGERNPIGLHLTFAWEDEEYVTYFTAKPEHQSYNGITHGGLVSTVLDEVMGRVLSQTGIFALTARMDLRLRLSVPIGERVRYAGRVVKRRGKVIDMAATAHLPDGRLAVEATARFLTVDSSRMEVK
ncbi:MAG: PaaI family thioesterase [Heliobacteriaceae bacterium]|nr:PaaI family thioesterase [Heliobacteriaceae bacterium]MDD4587750.1 PaaI family thioesterase [Heliobacteriaceae bacterium]